MESCTSKYDFVAYSANRTLRWWKKSSLYSSKLNPHCVPSLQQGSWFEKKVSTLSYDATKVTASSLIERKRNIFIHLYSRQFDIILPLGDHDWNKFVFTRECFHNDFKIFFKNLYTCIFICKKKIDSKCAPTHPSVIIIWSNLNQHYPVMLLHKLQLFLPISFYEKKKSF